jgi:hypothetical protein
MREAPAELGRSLFAASTNLHCARIDLVAGNLTAAETELRSAYDALTSSGETSLLPPIAEVLAQLANAQGRVPEGEEPTRAAAGLAVGHAVELEAPRQSIPKTAPAWRERADEAESHARESLELVRIVAALASLAGWCGHGASGDDGRRTGARPASPPRGRAVPAPGPTRERVLREILANENLPDGQARQLALETLAMPEESFAEAIACEVHPWWALAGSTCGAEPDPAAGQLAAERPVRPLRDKFLERR